MNMQSPIPAAALQEAPRPEKDSYNKYLWQGIIGLFLLVIVAGGWAMMFKISGAIIANGQIDVEGRPRVLQHLDGGIVGDILVKNGDHVEAGEIVLRLDPTASKANRMIVQKRLFEAQGRVDRLKAERDNLASITWSPIMTEVQNDPHVADIMAGQTKLFFARRDSLRGQIGQFRQRMAQLDEQVYGLQDLIKSKQTQLDIISNELLVFKKYEAKGAVSRNRILATEREKARFEGEIATHRSEIARIRSSKTETNIQVLQLQQDHEANILAELREVESELSDLNEQLTTASDQFNRVDITTPVTGIVHDLAVTTIGGVVVPGQELMKIIPDNDRLIIEAMISPVDIDQIYTGQKAVISLSAFNRRTTPQFVGHVFRTSPDSSVDEMTGAQYFTAWLEIDHEELEKLGDLTLLPGMPAECFIETQKHTVMSYLMKPFTDNLHRTFREE